jgi:hypothetical protein
MKDNIVTADDVAEATGRSVESVARAWHDIASDQHMVEAEAEESSTERHRMYSDD